MAKVQNTILILVSLKIKNIFRGLLNLNISKNYIYLIFLIIPSYAIGIAITEIFVFLTIILFFLYNRNIYLFKDKKVDEIFDCSQGHPIVLKKFLGGNISLETLVIYDRILGYGKDFDKKLKDPVWETVSKRVRKYTPFLNIDVFRYKKILKEVVISGT